MVLKLILFSIPQMDTEKCKNWIKNDKKESKNDTKYKIKGVIFNTVIKCLTIS